MAARRRGLTWLPPPRCGAPCGCGCGVLAPVARGVERFEGSSEVNMVAEEGEMRNLLEIVAKSASLKPSKVM